MYHFRAFRMALGAHRISTLYTDTPRKLYVHAMHVLSQCSACYACAQSM